MIAMGGIRLKRLDGHGVESYVEYDELHGVFDEYSVEAASCLRLPHREPVHGSSLCNFLRILVLK